MDVKLLEKAKEIEGKISNLDKVIKAIEDEEFDNYCFALAVECFGRNVPLLLTKDMTNDMLEVCRKYKSIYEKQLEEL